MLLAILQSPNGED